MPRPSRRRRGLTILETLVTAAVLILGIGVVASTVVSIVRLNRRNLAQAQAYTLAEWGLERITRMGCTLKNKDGTVQTDSAAACKDIRDLDNTSSILYWTASGVPSSVAPSGTEPARPYTVSIDVDPPFEGAELGAPNLERPFTAGGSSTEVRLKRTVNVRVTVSWKDDLLRDQSHAVALQTRVGP